MGVDTLSEVSPPNRLTPINVTSATSDVPCTRQVKTR
jgi:hypothetical protein